MIKLNEIELSKKLIEFPSVTPEDKNCLDYIAELLNEFGFTTIIKEFVEKEGNELAQKPVKNLYAVIGNKGPNLNFAGHVDVVPIIDEQAWKFGAFNPTITDNKLYGRGIVDMKGAIAAFIIACQEYLNSEQEFGQISLLLTADEEGPAINGTTKMLKWLAENDYKIDFSIIGEPTNPNNIGEELKIGRRGSVNFQLTIIGEAGHVAYPHNAKNPNPILIAILNELANYNFDDGNEFFAATNLEITNLDVGNKATNVIPDKAKANFNIRFNNNYHSSQLIEIINEIIAKYTDSFELTFKISGESFLCEPNKTHYNFQNIVSEQTKQKALFTTSGGTSDARFITKYCPHIEFGLINKTAHKINESCKVTDITQLKEIYYKFIENFFSNF